MNLIKEIMEQELNKLQAMKKNYEKYPNDSTIKIKLDRINERIKFIENYLQMQ